MITALAVFIGICAVLHCLRTARYKYVIREQFENDHFGDKVMMKSFKQFRSLYELAPEKYTVDDRFISVAPYIRYKTVYTEYYIRADTKKRFPYTAARTSDLYFENLWDFRKAVRLTRYRGQQEDKQKAEKAHIKAQKIFIEDVRRDLDLFEVKGVNEQ